MARCETRDILIMLNHEITIAGGGLAGLSLASGLRLQGVPVTILEAGSYPRHRVCGEFISGVRHETLENLGIENLFVDALQHCSLAWFAEGKLIHENQLAQAAIGISRYLLDERLSQHVLHLGATVRTGIRARPEPQDGFVWAAGRRPRNGRWIGLKAHVRNLPRSTDLEMHSGTNGYAGLTGVEEGWTNVCGLFKMDRSIQARGADLLPAYLDAGGNTHLAELIRGSEIRPDSFSAVAGFELGRQIPVPGLLTLGDAESMIPPFTGNGMSMAFQAAECAVGPLAEWSRGQRSWQEAVNLVRAALVRKFNLRLKSAKVIHPILLDRHGISFIQSLSSARLLPFRRMLSLVR
jgi:menaquinone-9 beta-reductase